MSLLFLAQVVRLAIPYFFGEAVNSLQASGAQDITPVVSPLDPRGEDEPQLSFDLDLDLAHGPAVGRGPAAGRDLPGRRRAAE
jgi:hypothetical protein